MSEVKRRPKKALLIGPPGSGKSYMIAKTAVRRPVHFVDIDNKIGSSDIFLPLITRGEISYDEVNERLDEETLMARIKQLTSGEKLSKTPLGWAKIAQTIENLPKSEKGKAAGTWAIDSLTLGGEHLKTLIMFYAGKNKYTFDQWAAYLSAWRDTIKVILDLAMENNKDVIMTVHERAKEVVGDRISGIKLTQSISKEGEVTLQRTPQGTMDVKIIATIDGSFGEHIGAYFDDYYALSVEMDGGKPKWVCRVRPDGRRDLRCSVPVNQDEYEPDFAKIGWKS